MRLRSVFLLSLVTFAMIGCAKEISSANNQVTATSQATPTTQLAKSENIATINSGTFVSGEHETLGTVSITSKNGKSFLELDQTFKTSNSGPDLVVVLHRSDNVIASTNPPSYPLKEGDYIFLGKLKKFSGAQTYEIPNKINLADYKSVAIWCRKFNATFGAAKLSN
jgi:Electron transfer DM13